MRPMSRASIHFGARFSQSCDRVFWEPPSPSKNEVRTPRPLLLSPLVYSVFALDKKGTWHFLGQTADAGGMDLERNFMLNVQTLRISVIQGDAGLVKELDLGIKCGEDNSEVGTGTNKAHKHGQNSGRILPLLAVIVPGIVLLMIVVAYKMTQGKVKEIIHRFVQKV